jgi:hypothetical protein
MLHCCNITKAGLVALALLLLVGAVLGSPQSGRPDDTPSIRRPKTPAPKPKTPKPVQARPQPRSTLTLKVSPPDSTVLLDNLGPVTRDTSTGIFTFSELKVATHSLTVHHDGYRNEERQIKLSRGENGPVEIVLNPQPGSLTVSPTVADAEISVTSNDANQPVAVRVGQVDALSLAPGVYEITIAKSGYQTLKRSITLQSAQSVYLEPKLEAIVKEEPRGNGSRATFAPLNSSVALDGKNLIVRLNGASGDASTAAGSILVAAVQARLDLVEVSGSLSGGPCTVEFIRLENVADSSLVEAPGPSNRWSLIVVRVRPKDSKRPVRFAINWRALPATSAAAPTGYRNASTEAEAIRKVAPAIPLPHAQSASAERYPFRY